MTHLKKPSQAEELKEMYVEDESATLDINPTPQAPRPKKKSSGFGKVLLSLVLILVIVFVLLLIISKTTNWNILGVSKTATAPNSESIAQASDWQAVFLTNGQVYFGKLDHVKSQYPVLKDIYYLQVKNIPIQPAEPATEEGGVQPAQKTQQQLILVKFGTELHKPMDKMFINQQHILMFEDLAEDSPVVKSINDYKAQQAKQASGK